VGDCVGARVDGRVGLRARRSGSEEPRNVISVRV
jgi:hypothetical protein